MDFKFVFRALRYRNYRLFFAGQSISLIGTWMQYVAMSWLVYRLTNSALLLGVVGFINQVPMFLITPFAGVIADRYNRKKILIITQVLAMLQALVLSGLVLTNSIQVWQIMLLSSFLGIVNSFDIPVRQAFTIEMIEKKEDLGNAIALNSSMVNVARLIGPSIGGIIIAISGEGLCFTLNAFSYIPVLISLILLKAERTHINKRQNNMLLDLKEGFIYAVKSSSIKTILMLLSAISFFGVSYQVLMPIFARDIFHGGPKTLGFLMAMSGVGALVAAIYLAGRKSVLGLGKIIALNSFIFALSVVIFSESRVLWFSMIVICFAGFSMMVEMAASNTILQTIVDEDKRGRIMSFYTMAFLGTAPFGSLLAGSLASRIGSPKTLFLSGVLCLAAAAIFFRNLPSLRKEMRSVYIKKGIIVDLKEGLANLSSQ